MDFGIAVSHTADTGAARGRLAAVGKVLTAEELDRAYALTGLGQGEGVYHNGMTANASMSGMQLARWLEQRLDNQLHNIDDVLARARYQLDTLKEKYPTIYRVFIFRIPRLGFASKP